jgi:hypothetical protein
MRTKQVFHYRGVGIYVAAEPAAGSFGSQTHWALYWSTTQDVVTILAKETEPDVFFDADVALAAGRQRAMRWLDDHLAALRKQRRLSSYARTSFA